MDTRRNLRCIIFYFSIYLLVFNQTANSENFENQKIDEFVIQNFPKEELDKFKTFFLGNCSNSKFLNNLRKHESYPQYGTINEWKRLCEKIDKMLTDNPKVIFRNFDFNYLSSKPGKLTAYYQPNILVSNTRTNKYKYPILKKRPGLMLERKKILETYETKDVLLWTNDDVELFFLHVQGSGIGIFENGKKVKISYAGNNGYEYRSIGKILIQKGFFEKKKIEAEDVKNWLRKNLHQKQKILNLNKRFIFFKVNEFKESHPIGSYGEQLVPLSSIAIDRKIYPYGIPFFLYTEENNFNFITFSADTGAAIKGPNRADIFFGSGENAGKKAGKINEKLILYFLKPKVTK